MKSVYKRTEHAFEKFSMMATKVLGNSITFLLAVILVFLYFSDERVYQQPRNKTFMDVIFTLTFLSLFVVQKSVNRFSAALHLKMNELLAAHEKASNRMVNIEEKTEDELKELAKHYSKLSAGINTTEDMHTSQSIEHIISATEDLIKEAKVTKE